MVLDESGFTLHAQRTTNRRRRRGRLDNLKELVRSMDGGGFVAGFLEHVSLVMELKRTRAENAST